MSRMSIAENVVHTIVFCSDDERSRASAPCHSGKLRLRSQTRIRRNRGKLESSPVLAADIVFIDSGLLSAADCPNGRQYQAFKAAYVGCAS